MMTDATAIIDQIRAHHRRRRFAMKIQQKLDRALESFVRRNMTEWRWDLPEAERSALNKKVQALIKSIRAGDADDLPGGIVDTSDRARAPADEMCGKAEKAMEDLAKQLPVYPWVEKVRGAGALGLATVVAECGDLSAYATVSKVWRRLGYAPYDGLAGSTWKRATWRPRALTAEEWTDNPFKGERYALMAQIVTWLVNAQTKSKTKTESGETEPTGPYGDVYCARRRHCNETHPDWSDGHRRSDALRITMKAFLKDLLLEWRVALPYDAANDASVQRETVATLNVDSTRILRPSSPARSAMKPIAGVPGSPVRKSRKKTAEPRPAP